MVSLADVAQMEGSDWATLVHKQMVSHHPSIPRQFPRTIIGARSMAFGLCGNLAQVEPFAEMMLAEARRAWTKLLEDGALLPDR